MEWVAITTFAVFIIGLGIIAGKAIHHASKD